MNNRELADRNNSLLYLVNRSDILRLSILAVVFPEFKGIIHSGDDLCDVLESLCDSRNNIPHPNHNTKLGKSVADRIAFFTLDDDSAFAIGSEPWESYIRDITDDDLDPHEDRDGTGLYGELSFCLGLEILKQAITYAFYCSEFTKSDLDLLKNLINQNSYLTPLTTPSTNTGTTPMKAIKDTANTVKTTQIEAAKLTAVVAVGKAGNAIATNLLKKHLPIYARGYVDQPLAQLAVASLLNTLAIHFLADNNKATAASAAMVQAAMLESADLINVKKLVDDLMSQLPSGSLDALVKQSEVTGE
jgi:hypothetical protein